MRANVVPEPTKRATWASETQVKLDDVFKRKRRLAQEESDVRAACNHTYPHGASALVQRYDDDGGTFTCCEVCGG